MRAVAILCFARVIRRATAASPVRTAAIAGTSTPADEAERQRHLRLAGQHGGGRLNTDQERVGQAGGGSS